MENISSYPTPTVARKQFTVVGVEVLQNPTLFRKLIGTLQYVTNSRPDISYYVNKLSRFLSAPTLQHWKAPKRILRYLNGTMNFGLHLIVSSNLNLTGYCDVDWAVSHEDMKSVTCYCVFLGSYLTSWASKRQNVVSKSSTKSEYRAVTDVAAVLIWIKSLMKEIHSPITKTPVIWQQIQFITYV